jgi:hypothetical protein
MALDLIPNKKIFLQRDVRETANVNLIRQSNYSSISVGSGDEITTNTTILETDVLSQGTYLVIAGGDFGVSSTGNNELAGITIWLVKGSTVIEGTKMTNKQWCALSGTDYGNIGCETSAIFSVNGEQKIILKGTRSNAFAEIRDARLTWIKVG